MFRTSKLIGLLTLALAASACNSHKNGAGADLDDTGLYGSMQVDSKGEVRVAAYWKSHKETAKATHADTVGALIYLTGKVNASTGVVSFGDPYLVDGDMRSTNTATGGGKNVGMYASLQLDKSDLAHVAYYDLTDGDLKYAYETAPNKWTVEKVDTAGNVGGHCSLVLEGENPRISYYDFDNKHLKFAMKNGGAWQTQTIDDGLGFDYGMFSSLASDGSGGLGIAFYDATNGDLGYVVGDGTSGFNANAIEWVDTANDVGRWPSLAYDLGTAKIAYHDNTTQHLMLAVRDGSGTWTPSIIDSTDWVGADTSMRIDKFGNVHIAYFDGMNNDQKYAKYDGNTWTIATIAAAGANGYYNNVALDPTNKPVFGWYSFTNTAFQARAGVPIP